jgi:hypothetical protein
MDIFEVGQLVTIRPTPDFSTTQYVICNVFPGNALDPGPIGAYCLQAIQPIDEEIRNSEQKIVDAQVLEQLRAKDPESYITFPARTSLLFGIAQLSSPTSSFYKVGDRIDLLPMDRYMYPNPNEIREWTVEYKVWQPLYKTWRLCLRVVDGVARLYCDETQVYVFAACCRKFQEKQRRVSTRRTIKNEPYVGHELYL